MSILTPAEAQKEFEDSEHELWKSWQEWLLKQAKNFVSHNPTGGRIEYRMPGNRPDKKSTKNKAIFVGMQTMAALVAKGWHVKFVGIKKSHNYEDASALSIYFDISNKPFKPSFWKRLWKLS